jgi:hypothetical protein
MTLSYRPATGWSRPLPADWDDARTWVLVFGASAYMDVAPPWADLARAFPQSVISGCSTAGEIEGTRVEDGTLSVAVVRFEHSDLRQVDADIHAAADPAGVVQKLADKLPTEGLSAVFVLCDGLQVNGSQLMGALADQWPAEVLITGGMAGDGTRFEQTWVVHQGRPATGRISLLGLYGERLKVGCGYDGGWIGFGPERRVTHAEGNVLYTLDDKPALDLYLDYLGELAVDLPKSLLLFPLAVRSPAGSSGTVVRSVLAVDEARRAVIFAGDVPQGHLAQLMRTTEDNLIASAAVAGARAALSVDTRADSLLVSVSCFGRRVVLGERTEEEVEAMVEGAPDGVTHLGFYSYGEFAPALPGGPPALHNQTMTVTVFSEE